MRNFFFMLFLVSAIAGCSTTASTQFYRAQSQQEPMRIAGKLEPWEGIGGSVYITINEREVIKEKLPLFTNTTEVSGAYEGRRVTVQLTRVRTFLSSYVRAEVYLGSEKAATLSF